MSTFKKKAEKQKSNHFTVEKKENGYTASVYGGMMSNTRTWVFKTLPELLDFIKERFDG